jgi:hypothetical protein
MKTLHILMGLPGAGKTFWAKKYAYNMNNSCVDDNRTYVISYDDNYKNMLDYSNDIVYYRKGYGHIIADFLCLSTDNILKFINSLENKFNEIIIHFWEPDVKKCLINDDERNRELKADITIKNTTLIKPDLNEIKNALNKSTNIELIIHTTECKKIYVEFFEKNEIDFDKTSEIIKSEPWCLGGTRRDCYGSTSYINEEDEPIFKDLEETIDKLCGDISHSMFRKIYNQVVLSDEYEEGDYYGGRITYRYNYFYIESLYDILKEENLIK